MDLTNNLGIGRICECSGNPEMLNTCFSYLRKGDGRVVLIGLPKQPLHVENVLQDIGNLLYCYTITDPYFLSYPCINYMIIYSCIHYMII